MNITGTICFTRITCFDKLLRGLKAFLLGPLELQDLPKLKEPVNQRVGKMWVIQMLMRKIISHITRPENKWLKIVLHCTGRNS